MTVRFTIVGAGSWGIALACYLARSGESVRLWAHDTSSPAELARTRRSRYLPEAILPPSVEVFEDLGAALDGGGRIILAVPSHHVRAVLMEAREAVRGSASVVVATKGIETGTLRLMTEVAAEALDLDPSRLAVLSGPSFAKEVVRGDPTAVVVAASSIELARAVQAELSSTTLRLYTTTDTTGVQVAGSLKNVMAIAAGILCGMGLGANSLAALLTRGLAEMSRLGMALGGRPETFAGLAGVGDLILTGTSDLSRNRSVGVELGRGRRPQEILSGMTMVAEGVRTAESAWGLAVREGVAMPIVEQVRRVLYDDVSPGAAMTELMTRPLRSEGWT